MKRVENMCAGKVPFASKEKANEAAKHLNKLGGKRVKTYRCSVCNFVHIGHESKGKLMNPKVCKFINDYVHKSKTHRVKNKFEDDTD